MLAIPLNSNFTIIFGNTEKILFPISLILVIPSSFNTLDAPLFAFSKVFSVNVSRNLLAFLKSYLPPTITTGTIGISFVIGVYNSSKQYGLVKYPFDNKATSTFDFLTSFDKFFKFSKLSLSRNSFDPLNGSLLSNLLMYSSPFSLIIRE